MAVSWGRNVLLAGGLLMTGGVSANGISVDEMTVRRLGDAFSGGAADTADASAVWYNPAAITCLQKPQITGGLVAIPHKTRFDGKVVDAFYGDPVGGHNKTWKDTELIPNVYSAIPVVPGWWFGVGVNSPWGTGTRFDRRWVGRYQSIESELLTVNLLTVLGWQVTDSLSLGGGLVTEYADGKIERAIIPLFGHDGRFKSNGNDTSMGLIFGVFYQPRLDWQLGINYRSAIRHTLEGDMEVTLPDVHIYEPRIKSDHTKLKGRLKLDIPETLSLSAIHSLTPEWRVKADATWTRWSRWDQLVFEPKRPEGLIEKAEVQPMDWHDTWRFSVGVEYQLTSIWVLRAGIAYDESPTPNHTATVDFAIDDYRAVSVGATWTLNSELSVDMALQHTWSSRRSVHEEVKDPSGQTVIMADGKVTNRINSVGIGIRWLF
ncbi:OmpP1/FadL family transporter [Sansalvadorimonas verongulae]|uniref:OmpP1/FadL family transporter n=1 Tax=Sansalvadorimonas verongulae TaxID=2172824 RepID=UPI0012BBAB78|nr:OmpP1/FadL family transporter [Sansalvadorimonas verongulae]MTI12987.1 transporter [Sansalvadorimonas verongulae]